MSHAEEINQLLGNDRAYVDAVQNAYYQAEAGRHVRRMLGLLLLKGDFVPQRDLAMLAAEYDHICSGRWLLKDATVHANPCDCDPAFLEGRDGRCIEGVGVSDPGAPR